MHPLPLNFLRLAPPSPRLNNYDPSPPWKIIKAAVLPSFSGRTDKTVIKININSRGVPNKVPFLHILN